MAPASTIPPEPGAEILAVGMVTPVGLSGAATAAALRAGIQRTSETHLFDKHGEPLVMGLVPDEHLPPLAARLAATSLPRWWERLVRLSARAVGDALAPVAGRGPVPLLLGAPLACADPAAPDLLELVAKQAGEAIDRRRSRLFPLGRASGLIALGEALAMLQRREVPVVAVGGVDSYFDSTLLRSLDREGRLKTGPISDGFIPGEGAAVVLLGAPGIGGQLSCAPFARLRAVGQGREPGHLYSDEAYRGDGLADAFERLFAACAPAPRVSCVYAGFNGESFWAKEWGVASLRSRAHFDERVEVEHPVEGFGDPGAALGPILLGVAAVGLQRGYRASPLVVFCSSDREERAAALLDSSHHAIAR